MPTGSKPPTKQPAKSKGATQGLEGSPQSSVEPLIQSEPKPPFPEQKLEGVGLESNLDPKPRYQASRYKAAGKLEGKCALITGGDSGIGRAVAVLYAREGADVAIVYMPQEEEDALETENAVIAEGQSCLRIPGDVCDSAFCEEAVQTTVNTYGWLDILVNNAAYQHQQPTIEDVTDEQFERTFRTNIFGYFYMARAAVARMEAGSAIVNTGSITGLQGSKNLLDYSATKGAIHAFTKSLAQSLVERGIRVNCVAPGPIWTPLNVADKPARKAAKHGSDTPMRRPGQPEEVAPAYVFFAANADSSYITGEVLTLLGGETTAG
jgi:NAD(P)-dependent dehydrogenase (short-subunit alcohol dehydrogenase family)